MKTRSYSAWRLEKLSDPERAARYLSAALSDSTEAFLYAFKNVLHAHEVTAVAKKAGVTRESLYRSFSATGNPTLETLNSVLGAINLKISGVESRVKTSTLPPSREPVRSAHARKRRRRGVGGHSQYQLSLPFDAGLSVFVTVAPNTLGINVSLAQQQRQIAGAGILRDVVPETNYQSSSLPRFISYYAMQNESAAGFVYEGQP